MRTTIRKSVLVAFLFGTLISYANEKVNPIKAVDAEKEKSAIIEVKKGEVFTIKNEQGVSLYSNAILNNGDFEKVFDLTTLEDGKYIAELEKANEVEVEVKQFMVENNTVTFLTEEKIYKPVVRTKGDLLLISKLNFSKAPVDVKIYYEGYIIFSEKVKNNDVILNRIYKLSASETGDYKIVFKANNRIFKENFSI